MAPGNLPAGLFTKQIEMENEMSDSNMELIGRMADIPLPLMIQFNSKKLRLDELTGSEEAGVPEQTVFSSGVSRARRGG